jgi:hypothetical protein
MKVLKDIEIAEGVIIKKGADIEMDGFGDLIITRGKDSYVWSFNTYDIMDEVISQHGLDFLENNDVM